MKTLIASMALGLAFAVAPAIAADAPAKKPSAVVKHKSLMGVKGRYHQLHKSKAKLDCGDCHSQTQEDTLFLRKDDPMSPALGKVGQVDRNGCLNCHEPGSKKKGKGAIPSFWGV